MLRQALPTCGQRVTTGRSPISRPTRLAQRSQQGESCQRSVNDARRLPRVSDPSFDRPRGKSSLLRRVAEERAEAVRTDPQPAADDQDPADLALGQGTWPMEWPRRAVLEPCLALRPIPPEPLVRGRPADPELLGCGGCRPALDQDAIDQEPSAERRELGRTMEHESPPSEWSFDNPIPSTRALNLSTT
jgi:hypothetical protein